VGVRGCRAQQSFWRWFVYQREGSCPRFVILLTAALSWLVLHRPPSALLSGTFLLIGGLFSLLPVLLFSGATLVTFCHGASCSDRFPTLSHPCGAPLVCLALLVLFVFVHFAGISALNRVLSARNRRCSEHFDVASSGIPINEATLSRPSPHTGASEVIAAI
jgi:amino acid transporter